MNRTALALIALGGVTSALMSVQPAAAQDGARLFNLQCRTCHGDKSTPMGPTLAGVAGAPIAGRSDFTYSAGLKSRSGAWTDANLDAYLAKPLAFAPGTRMVTAVPSAENRAALIAHMKTLK